LYDRWREKRDADAFAELVSRHADMVFSACKRILRNAPDAEDATQECFLDLMGARVRVRSSLAPWLYTVAVRRALDMARRQTTKLRYHQDRRHEVEPASRVENDDLKNVIDEAIAQLPKQYQVVVIERFLESKTHAELAEYLGVSESTIRYRLTKGVDQIRHILKQKGIHTSAGALLAVFGAGLAESAPTSLTARLGRHAISGSSVGHAAAVAAIGEALVVKKALIGTGIVLTALLVGFGALRLVSEQPASTGAADQNTSVAETRIATDDAPTASTLASVEPIMPAIDSVATALPVTPQLEHCEIAAPALYCSISGRVVDEDGQPVANAEALLVCHGYEEDETIDAKDVWVRRAMKRNHHYRATSDTDGNYAINSIRFRGLTSATATIGEFASSARNFVLREGESAEGVDLVVEAATRVTLVGRILAPNGSPVDDGVVRAQGLYAAGLAYTDQNGNFTTTTRDIYRFGTQTSVTDVSVYSPTFGSATITEVPVGTGETVELIVPHPVTMRGNVVWADGTPTADTTVRLEGGIPHWRYHDDGTRSLESIGLSMSYEATIDESGQYEIPGIDAGQYYVRVAVQDAEGKTLAEERLEFLPPTIWNAKLGEPINIFGTVLGERSRKPLDGRPLKVCVLRDGIEVEHVNVDEDGRYGLELPAIAGPYIICPAYEPFAGAVFKRYGKSVYLDPGEEVAVDLAIFDLYSQPIRVIDEFGKPIAGATVFGHDPVGITRVGETNADGRFTCADLLPAFDGVDVFTHLTVIHPDYCEEYSTPRVGEPGAVYPEETILLYGKASIEGRIVYADGSPAQNTNVSVRITYADGRSKSASASTSQGGVFRLTDTVPATTIEVAVGVRADGADSVDLDWKTGPVTCAPGDVLDLGDFTDRP
jgi:RNA polymerase sigma factor (sigma-70 family)